MQLRISTHKMMCDKHFQMPGHNFNVHAKFTIIEEVYIISMFTLSLQSLKRFIISYYKTRKFAAC